LADGELDINGSTTRDDVTIVGAGTNGDPTISTRIDAQSLSRVFQIFAGNTATISGAIIQNGLVTGALAQGGGIYNAGMLTLSACTLQSDQAVGDSGVSGGAAEGGGVYNAPGATLNLNDDADVEGTATGGTGSAGVDGDAGNLNNPTAYDGTSGGDGGSAFGGGVYNAGTLVIAG